ncbi:MAG TPA: response regulator [Firmicutes bacterium]|nr:response regulator [Bacillota bacterium]
MADDLLVDRSILIVDDEDYIRLMVNRILTQQGYYCAEADSAAAALKALSAQPFALIITDLMMPGMSGLELLAEVQQVQPDAAIIVLTGVDSQQTAIKALELGAFGYMIKPFQANELLINVVNALRRRELEKLRSEYQQKLEREVEERTREVYQREAEITFRLIAASEYRHYETGAHIRRMAKYATLLASKIGWPEDQVSLLRLAAPMHDIGKIGVSDTILMKPGPLTPAEYDVMKRHTIIGARILSGSEIPLLKMAKFIALHHHERWNGTGYPQGLAGEAIPEAARIVAIADVYDALHTDRVYRPAYSEQEAMAILMSNKESFDPRLFKCMCDCYKEFGRYRQEFVDTPFPSIIDPFHDLEDLNEKLDVV